ncbi:thiamine pyrophosphate-binding protein [Actinophytocola sp.]|uniref:thiamine pyrophosphate-binding protein n=1 Tax=Actinophytocola sp. TaxID=1872138 RepID=UPI003D6C6897
MNVAELACRVLVAEGVDTAFGLLGHGNVAFAGRLPDAGIRYHGARHEGNAVAMADGYARATGRVGLCTVTLGPGLTNTLTALITARRARTPLVLIAGEGSNSPADFQHFDQTGFFELAGVPARRIREPATVAADLATAVRLAVAERMPVGVNLPRHLQQRECAVTLPEPPRSAMPRAPDLAAVRRAADVIERARRPVVLAGRGAVTANARHELETLARQVGALLATSLPAKAYFADDPFSIGVSGGFATRLSRRLLRDADCVLVFGASLNDFTTDHGEAFAASAPVVRVDTDAAVLGTNAPARGVLGDAALAAAALRAELDRRGFHQEGYRTSDVRAVLAAWRPDDELDDTGVPGALDPRALVAALDRILPSRRVVVVDGGNTQGYPSTYLSVPEPSSFLHMPGGFGAIGCGLGAAIGAAVGRPDRLTVAVLGDGSLMMSSSDLDASVRFGVPLVVVVLDDGGFGAEVHALRALDLPHTGARYASPDFVGLARAVGGDGATVDSLDDLRLLERDLADPRGLFVVDCKISSDPLAEWAARLAGTGRRPTAVEWRVSELAERTIKHRATASGSTEPARGSRERACGANHQTQGDRERLDRACEGES